MLKRKTQELDAFYSLVKRFQESPDPNSVTSLTDMLSQMMDLSEHEQDLALGAIERIPTKLLELKTKPDTMKLTGERENLDPSTQRLIEFLRMPTFRSHVLKILNLVKQWFYHFCQDNEAEVDTILTELASVCNVLDMSASSTFADMAALSKTACLSLVKARPSQVKALYKAFACNSISAKLIDAFELLHVKQEVPAEFKQGKSVLLCHCTRHAENVDKILRDGLQVKGESGRFGPAIYLSDAISKSLGYSGISVLKDGETYGVVLIVEAYLGRIRVCDRSTTVCFTKIQSGTSPSEVRLEFDIIQGPGMNSVHNESITFRDGTQSEIAIGPFCSQTHATSAQPPFDGVYNEFALIEPSRLRIRFVLLYKIEASRPYVRPYVRPVQLPVYTQASVNRPVLISQPIIPTVTGVEPRNRVGAVNDVVVIDQDDVVVQAAEEDDEVVAVERYAKRTQLTYLQVNDTRARLMKELIQKRDRYIVLEGPNSEQAQRLSQKLQLFCDPDIHDHLRVLLEL